MTSIVKSCFVAAKAGYRTLLLEAHEDKSLAALLVPPLRKLLFELDRVAGAGDKAKRALAVLKGFMNGVKVTMGDIEVGLDIEPEKGAADSGDLESDLPNLFLAVAQAAEERKTPIPRGNRDRATSRGIARPPRPSPCGWFKRPPRR